MPQRRVFGDASEFPFYDLRDVLLDLRIIASDDLLHTIHAVGIAERGYFRDRNVRSRLPGELLPVDDDLGMEDLLFDAFVEIVRHGTHEHALREVGNLRGGNQAVELRIGRGGEVVVAQRVGGPQLHDPAEALAQRLGRISQNLTCEDVAHGILDDLGFLLAVVAFELREVLKALLSDRIVFLQQRILREPSTPIGIVHARPEIDIGKTQKCLLLLSGEPMTVVGNRSLNRNPSFAERIVIVLFNHRTVGGDDLPHAAQMIRQEIVYFRPPAVVRADDPAVVERGALECVYGSIIRRIYQRTNIECLLTIIILVPACSSIRKIFKKWE